MLICRKKPGLSSFILSETNIKPAIYDRGWVGNDTLGTLPSSF